MFGGGGAGLRGLNFDILVRWDNKNYTRPVDSVSEEYNFQRKVEAMQLWNIRGWTDGWTAVCAGNNGGNWARPFSSGRC